ncbi:MAG: hypothetical protein J0H14_01600 [Alphaproteobacteria bacterium]|nr:hypothetical protein [Alphaproteobacteria bacterium]
MSLSADDIYALLPAIHRTRDAAVGEPLKALIGIIAEQASVIEQDLRGLYADQFIETCAPWVVPYIGDLIGWTGLFEGIPNGARSRAEVGNTMGYRRRKGTVIALEQIGRDVTGRPVHIVEYFRRLAIDESFRHLRPHHAGFADLRRGAALERIGGAFDTLNRTVDVRRIASRVRAAATPDGAALDIALHGVGKPNIPDIGAWIWRWIAYPVTGQPATPVDARRFLFSTLGADMPLFNFPPPRESFASLTVVYADGTPLELDDICVCNLSDSGGGWATAPAGKVAIDPVLGRIAFAADRPAPAAVTLDYNYGFPADLGGGPYDRSSRLPLDRSTVTWSRIIGAGATDIFGVPLTLADAVAEFNARPPGAVGLIVLADFMVADIDLTGANAIQIPSGSQLWIIGAEVHGAGAWTPTRSRVTLRGDINVFGVDAPTDAAQGQLFLNGLLIAGTLRVSGHALGVTLQDSTLVPGRALTPHGLPANPGEPSLVAETAGGTLTLDRCITGPVLVHAAASARVTNSVIDATARWRVAYAGPDLMGEGGSLHVEDSTVIGKLRTHRLPLASNTIFLARRPVHDPWAAAIWCTRRQSGCVRFCFVPSDAITPGQYRCLPGANTSLEYALAPQFVSLRYGSPSYALLSGDCPVAVWQGADDESQIGAYHLLYETQGVGNLRTRIDEYLPFGLEAGIFLVPLRAERPREEPPAAYGPGQDRGAEIDSVDALQWHSIGAALI